MWPRRKHYTPQPLTPKEMLALMQASHVSADEISQWHEDFLEQHPSGHMDKESFITFYKKLFPKSTETNDSFDGIFERIDVDHDGTVDFNELLVVIVLTSRLNDLESRLAFAFDTWDHSADGFIEQNELSNVISAIYDRAGVRDRRGDRDPKKRATDIISRIDLSGDKKLSKEEFINGCKNDPHIRNLLAPDA